MVMAVASMIYMLLESLNIIDMCFVLDVLVYWKCFGEIEGLPTLLHRLGSRSRV